MAESHVIIKQLTKYYPGQQKPAVGALDLEIPRGEIVMLVGSSGCGKTTTLKMINRIIEATSGKVLIDGQDTSQADPDEMRRSIGYVIQQVGLFPHMSVGDNVAAVPRLLRWPKTKIRTRVDELLELVELDPSVYRNRYPKQLSGGQQQRVGVARALAADPPVMLMDEPFGAVDEINRKILQSELRRLQQEFHKTIVFVTHDISEALTVGDRVAIFGQEATLIQYDTPQRLLTNPNSELVSDLLGRRAGLRALEMVPVTTSMLRICPTAADISKVDPNSPLPTVLCRNGRPWALALAEQPEVALPIEPLRLSPGLSLADVASSLLISSTPYAVMVDNDGYQLGCLDLQQIQERVSLLHEAPRDSVSNGGRR